jgi:hypothetical protein
VTLKKRVDLEIADYWNGIKKRDCAIEELRLR